MKKVYVVSLFFLAGSAVVSCKTANTNKAPETSKTVEVSTTSNSSTQKFVPWKQTLVTGLAYKAHEGVRMKVLTSESFKLEDKRKYNTNFSAAAMTEIDSSSVAIVPAGTEGVISEFFKTDVGLYLKVEFTFKSGAVASLFFKEQRDKNEDLDRVYVLCTEDSDPTKNVADVTYKGRVLRLPIIVTDPQKKCILLAPLTPISVQTNITE